jgi:hypothetical protein
LPASCSAKTRRRWRIASLSTTLGGLPCLLFNEAYLSCAAPALPTMCAASSVAACH